MEPISFVAAVGMAAVTGIGSWIAAFYGAYWKKKGEQAATHEDLENVLMEVRVVTKSTEEIKADISGGLWDRQKQWELKRDVLLDLTKKSGDLRDIFTKYHSISKTNSADKPLPDQRIQLQLDVGQTFLNVSGAFDTAAMHVGVVCEKDVYVSALMLTTLAKNIFEELQADESVPYHKLIEKFSQQYALLHNEIRKELGFAALKKAEPQSTVSSAAPDPTKQVPDARRSVR
jgi:hypothetical protein